nr:MAG TPA: Minor capsid protein from bacteriophage [Caudoviricetes sp.]
MTDLERLRAWIATYPGYNILDEFQCDFTDQAVPGNAGVFPAGLVEVERRKDVLGDVVVTNQYNFSLYYVFAKPEGDDGAATVNADWVMDFQRWVQAQSVLGLAPKFGNIPDAERIIAQNGVLYDADKDGTVGIYMVQLSATYKLRFEEENPWLT